MAQISVKLTNNTPLKMADWCYAFSRLPKTSPKWLWMNRDFLNIQREKETRISAAEIQEEQFQEDQKGNRRVVTELTSWKKLPSKCLDRGRTIRNWSIYPWHPGKLSVRRHQVMFEVFWNGGLAERMHVDLVFSSLLPHLKTQDIYKQGKQTECLFSRETKSHWVLIQGYREEWRDKAKIRAKYGMQWESKNSGWTLWSDPKPSTTGIHLLGKKSRSL